MPPGFLDDDKEHPLLYGDLVLWRQTLDKARDAHQSVILVTDENKEDWWWEFRSLTLGPRPELVAEISREADVDFYMYTSERFLEEAGRYFDQEISPSTLEEAKKVRVWAIQDEDRASGMFLSRYDIEEMLLDGFPSVVVCKLVGLTYRQLDYWNRTGLIAPSIAEGSGSGTQRLYSKRDILTLMVVKAFVDSGLSLQRVREAGVVEALGEVPTEELGHVQVLLTADGAWVLPEGSEEARNHSESGTAQTAIRVDAVATMLQRRLDAAFEE